MGADKKWKGNFWFCITVVQLTVVRLLTPVYNEHILNNDVKYG